MNTPFSTGSKAARYWLIGLAVVLLIVVGAVYFH
jgi:hypothetical protein